MSSIWYRLLYSYVNSFKAIKLTHYKRLLQVITSLPPLEAVVDIGAGYGIIADLIHQRIGALYLIEKNPALLEKLVDKTFELGNVNTILADALYLPFRKDFADFVYFYDSFDEITNKILALKEAARIVKRGGYIAVLDWDRGRLMARIKEILLQKTGFPVNCWNLEETISVIKRIGLRMVVAKSNLDGSMIILAKK